MTDQAIQLFREKWAESTALKQAANVRLGEEKISLVRGSPLADESTGMYARTKTARSECKDIAADYFEANPGDFARFQGLEREHLVNLISIARTQGNADEATLIDMWLLVHFEPQVIRGNFRQPAPGRGR